MLLLPAALFTGATNCPAPSPHVEACTRCRAATSPSVRAARGGPNGVGRAIAACGARHGWDWQASLEANDRKTAMPGLEILRGMDGARAAGVETLASWNQSNWPALVLRQPARVRAASMADRARLCALWAREHSYQSFPVLLGCPGRAAREYEELCASEMAVIRIPCAAIDLSGDPTTAGALFDEKRWWRVSHCTHPPKPCNGRRVVRMASVAVALSVYPTGVGHFVPEQLPKLLLLHKYLPANVPLLVADHPSVRRYMQPLVAAGVMPQERVHYQKMGGDGTIVHADHVYTLLSSHFSNIMSGDTAMLDARSVLEHVPPFPKPPLARTHILLIDRGRGKARSVLNAQAVVASIQQAAASVARRLKNEHGLSGGGNAAAAAAIQSLSVHSWAPTGGANMTNDIAAFRHAALVVAPHGAGLANMLLASEGTPVIEICYDDYGNARSKGMACPAMYAAMAANLHLPYYVTSGKGTYGTAMAADVTQLSAVVAHALGVVYGVHGGGGGGGAQQQRDSQHTGHHHHQGSHHHQHRHEQPSASNANAPRHAWKELPTCAAVSLHAGHGGVVGAMRTPTWRVSHAAGAVPQW